MQRSLGGNEREQDEFFFQRQEAFMKKLSDMGMDIMEIKDFIEDHGMYEENPEVVIDFMGRP